MSEITHNKDLNRIRLAIGAILLVSVLTQTIDNAFNVIASDLVVEFTIPSNIASLVASIGSIGLAIGFIMFSSLSDFFSEKRMIITGILLFCIGSVIGILFQSSYYMVVFARFIQAVGGISAAALYLVLIARYLPEKEQFIWMGLSTTSFSLSTMLGATLGGYMSTNLGWQSVFFVPFIGLLALPIIIRCLPENPKAHGKVDYIGFILLAVLTIFVNFLVTSPNWLFLIFAFLAIISFWVYLNKAKTPFFSPNYLRNKGYVLTLFATFLFYLGQVGLVVLVPFLMQSNFETNLSQASQIFIIPYIISSVLAAFSGNIINRIGLKSALNTGGILIIIGLIYGSYLGGYSSTHLSISLIIITCGYALTFSPFLVQAISSLPPEEVGIGIGLFNFVVRIACALGISIVGYFLNTTYIQKNIMAIPNENMVIYGNILLFFMITVVVSLILYNIRSKADKA